MTTNFSNSAGDGVVDADGFTSDGGAPKFPAGIVLPNGAAVSVQDNITAHAGGGKTNAFPLTAVASRVVVVATANDSVLLPPATLGRIAIVTNFTVGGAAMQVFGQGTDTINGIATATGVSIGVGHTAILVCYSVGEWAGPIALA